MESSGGKQRSISKHEIFLSHSGQEKTFVEALYYDLKRANHHPFFDSSSLSIPKGESFALKILEAAEQCLLAVVVLSEKYLTSKWTMLELNKFVESKKTSNAELRLFPLFFKLSPSDLKESEVETKWKPRWRQMVGEDSVELWSEAVKELRLTNGLDFAKFANSEYKYRCAVVDITNKLLPPIVKWDIGHIQGYERLCKVTSSMLNEGVSTKNNIVHYYLGLYGAGGVGKTTLCKAMCNFLQVEFGGRVCHVELIGECADKRLERINVVCQQLASLERSIAHEEQGWKCLENGLRNMPPVFLAIDNVEDSKNSQEEAQKYLKALPSGSKVIVTSRRQGIVKSVLCQAKYCKAMPMLEWQEATMLFLSNAAPNRQLLSSLNVEEREIVERCLKECQFIDIGYSSKQYHPSALRVLGVCFNDEDSGMNVKKWKESLENKGHNLNEILGLGYHSLSDQAKRVFIDSALYYSDWLVLEEPYYWWRTKDHNYFEQWILWISDVHKISPSYARTMMEDLQRLSLLGVSSSEVLVHDLYREFARVLVETKKSKEWEWWMSDVSIMAQLERFVMRFHKGEYAPLSGHSWPSPPEMHIQKQLVKLPSPPPNDNVLHSIERAALQDNEISGAVASSSGYNKMEEHVVKKVQSKDLKSGRLIGKGPSSIVYETTFEGKRYARKDFLRVPSDVFEKEAAVLASLHHPNIVSTHYWTVDEGSCSLVLELMDDDLLNMMHSRKDSQRKKSRGSGFASQTSHVIDLRKFIEDGKKAPIAGTSSTSVALPPVYPFDMAEGLEVMQQIALGMKFLHDNGVAHGYLKPKNILVTMNGRAASSSVGENVTFKVADFGLVGTKMKSRSLVSRQARKMEMVRWRAPELLGLRGLREDEHKSSLDSDSDWDSDSSNGTIGEIEQSFTFTDMARADVYSFGLTCSEILHGEVPFSGLGVNELVNKIILPGVRPDLPPTCPDKLRALITSCWGEKTERPSFQDILSELEDLQASFPQTGSPMTGPSSFDPIDSKLVSEHSAAKITEIVSQGREIPNFKKVWKSIKKRVGAPIGQKQ